MKNLKLKLAALTLCLAAVPACAGETENETESPDDDARWIRENRLRLDWQPVGPVLEEGRLRLGTQIPMHPAGFRADTYDIYLSPTYGLGDGWQVTAGVTGAERLGRGGEALFYGAGVQKQIVGGRKNRPAISVGGYGMAGPHDHHSGALFLAATHRVWANEKRKLALYVHGGARYELYGSDDYGSSSGIRPYAGFTLGLRRDFSISGDYSLDQAWEERDMWSLRATARVYKGLSVTGGIRSSGYRTHPFVGLTF